MKTLQDFLYNTQQDPDEVGQSEYRTVYETLVDVSENEDGTDPARDLDLAEATLTELIEQATAMRSALAGYLAGA